MLETEYLKIATAGLTVDGREIKAEWLGKMAKSYDSSIYTATVNIDHFGMFGSGMGMVTGLQAKKDPQGRDALYAKVSPTAYLLNIWQSKDKNFFSIEPVFDFPNKGDVYLAGLAVTDIPASQGLEPVKFSKGGQAQVFHNTAAMSRPVGGSLMDWEEMEPEAAPVQMAAEQPDERVPAWASKVIRALFSAKHYEDEPMTAEERAAFEKLQGEVVTLVEKYNAMQANEPAGQKGEFNAQEAIEGLSAQVAELADKFTTTEKKVEQVEEAATEFNAQEELGKLAKQISDMQELMSQPQEGPSGEVTGATPKGEQFVA